MKLRTIPAEAQPTHEYMAIGGQSWGRAPTWEEAKKQLRKQSGARVTQQFIVPKGARLDDITGSNISWNADTANGDHGPDRCPHCAF